MSETPAHDHEIEVLNEDQMAPRSPKERNAGVRKDSSTPDLPSATTVP